MPEFVFMLTRNDQTIPNAHEVLDDIADLGLTHIGFKDVGLPFTELRGLACRIHDQGARAYLEVVSVHPDDERRSIEAALTLGVDVVLGGTTVDTAVRVLDGSPIEYYPFPGRVEGHPSHLLGEPADIVASARTLAAHPGVHGLDLLAYRHAGNAAALARDVVAAVDIPVLAAGSVDTAARITALTDAGVWGFTIGTAILDGTLSIKAPTNSVRDLVAAVRAAADTHTLNGSTT